MSTAGNTASRLLRGSIASWVRLGVTLASQILVVPVILSFWSAERYGLWLLLQAAVAMIKIPGIAHQDFVGYDLMKSLHIDSLKFRKTLSSALQTGTFYGALELGISFLLTWLLWGPLSTKYPSEPGLLPAFLILMLGSSLIWNWAGLWVRVANATGHYERSAWWGVADVIVRLVVPLVVMPLGADLLGAAIAYAAAVLLLHGFTAWDLIRTTSPNLPPKQGVCWRLGWRNFGKSQALALKSLLEMSRQQGARMILAPLAGGPQLAAFATMRTGANVVVQGLATITSPMVPELMRFLHQKDQGRSEAALGTVWLVVLCVMSPCLLILQLVAPHLFVIWTRGQIPFDPLLFALLSIGVLIVAISQPASSVVRGNNLLKGQVAISATAAVIVVGGMAVCVPWLGLVGAGAALLAAELVSAAGDVRLASAWLHENALAWPAAASRFVTSSAIITSSSLVAMSIWPRVAYPAVVLGLLGQAVTGVAYWKRLPLIARDRANRLLMDRLPPSLRKILQSIQST